jgi:hypothetical protein
MFTVTFNGRTMATIPDRDSAYRFYSHYSAKCEGTDRAALLGAHGETMACTGGWRKPGSGKGGRN